MDAEFKKALKGGIWAADRTDNVTPESTAVTPTLVRTQGYPEAYSRSSGGVTVDRRRMNQQLRELYGAAFHVREGIPTYDSEVEYPVGCVTKIGSQLWISVKVHAADTGESPTDNGQTTWEAVSGSTQAPEAPRDITFDNSTQGQMGVKWKNGQDGGARIESYDLQYRIRNGSESWSPVTPISAPFAQHTLTGLTSGNQIQVQVRARTNIGVSPWAQSTYGTGDNPPDVVRGNVPGGGPLFGLLATARDASVDLSWSVPPDGGFPIKRYLVQWRARGATFSANNQQYSDNTTSRVSSLINDTTYEFRVLAENSQGQGPWSNIAVATPLSSLRPRSLPTPIAPYISRTASSLTANARWSSHPTNPTANPTSAFWQWRRGTSGPWTSTTYVLLNGFTVPRLSASSSYQVRTKLRVSGIGDTAWGPPATASAVQSVTPGAPRNLGMSIRIGPGSIQGRHHNLRLSWSPPSNIGGSPITEYIVTINYFQCRIRNTGSVPRKTSLRLSDIL